MCTAFVVLNASFLCTLFYLAAPRRQNVRRSFESNDAKMYDICTTVDWAAVAVG